MLRSLLCIRSGNGVPKAPVEAMDSVQALMAGRRVKNEKLLAKLREDASWKQVLDMCLDDARKGRMRVAVLANQLNLSEILISPRFCVSQGVCSVHGARKRRLGSAMRARQV